MISCSGNYYSYESWNTDLCSIHSMTSPLTKQTQDKLTAAQTNVHARNMITCMEQHLGQRQNNSHTHNQQCGKNEMVLGMAHQPPQRRSTDLTCHHVETIRQEQTTSETSQTTEIRPGHTLNNCYPLNITCKHYTISFSSICKVLFYVVII